MPNNTGNAYRTTPGLLFRTVGVVSRYVLGAALVAVGGIGMRHGLHFWDAYDLGVGAWLLWTAFDRAGQLIKYADRPKYPAHGVE